MLARWFKGLLLRLPVRLAGAIGGVALAVALMGSIGGFIASSAATMTQRAIERIPVDWQVQLTPGTRNASVIAALGRSAAYTTLQSVDYAEFAGLSLTTQASAQVTGPGKALGISSGYRRDFPGEIRPLVGAAEGILLAQQAAANLHAHVGDTIAVKRIGLPPERVRIDGIVDLPAADSLFQAIGLPPGAAPQAPPDNVVLLPATVWHRLFDRQAVVRPDSVGRQLHVRLAHGLPSDPAAAYVVVGQKAKNFESRVAGSAVVGDNLAAALFSARADALYARVLFSFLGLPGVVLAVLLTVAVANSGVQRRRREQALLRVRGASTLQIIRFATLEAGIVAVVGAILGTALAIGEVRAAGSLATATTWLAASAIAGMAVAMVAVLAPAWMQAHEESVVAARAAIGIERPPLWQGLYLDVALLAISGAAFWLTARNGYQVVLAPEGVPQSSVQYGAFLGPFLLWIGAAMLTVRFWSGLLGRRRDIVGMLVAKLAGSLRGVVAASISRQSSLVTRGIVLVALAFSFAASTAIFNTTYNVQVRVDAQLTNGADVTVMGPLGSNPAARIAALRAVPGVLAASPMQHRFAYVGADLQDFYGIEPGTLPDATVVSNAYFADHDVRGTLEALRSRRDGMLVSEETVRDYQLNPGDLLNLRLQSAADHKYHVVPFHLVGVVREFPTAPKDSFLVANADYVAARTHSSAAEIVLLRVRGDPSRIAARVRAVVDSLPGIRVTDINTARTAVASSLTAVDLRGLTGLELVFAVLFIVAASGLVLALGLAERRRNFAILTALGAQRRQLGAFVWSESLIVLLGGALVGIALGTAVAWMLVKVLTGVFDPPPEVLAVPWGYLALVVGAAFIANLVTVYGAIAAARRTGASALRDL